MNEEKISKTISVDSDKELDVSLNHIKDFYYSSRPHRRAYFDRGVLANFVPYKDEYVGSCRTGNMSGDDKIQILKFDSDLNLVYSRECTKGEDPRSFIYNGHPYAYVVDPHHSETGSWIFHYKVVDLISGHVTILSIDQVPDTKVQILGKNWIPLVRDNILYFVVTINPHLTILRCQLVDGRCTWVTPFELVKDELKITTSRGSTPLIFSHAHDRYVGIGHRTHNCNHHSPFLYTVSKDFSTAYVGPDISIKRNGILDGPETRVSDALSIYEKGGNLFCCISHYPTQLGDTQRVCSSLYGIKINEQ